MATPTVAAPLLGIHADFGASLCTLLYSPLFLKHHASDVDSAVDGEALTLSSFTVAGISGSFNPGDTGTLISVGSLQMNADGSYRFAPAKNYHSTLPQATYSMSDSRLSSTAMLNLNESPRFLK